MKKEKTRQYHIQLKLGDVGRYVLLPGDPGRCEKIAAFFDNPQFIAQNREFTTYTGSLLDQKVSVVSTGIGCPSTAIAVEELIKIDADTFIRVGREAARKLDLPYHLGVTHSKDSFFGEIEAERMPVVDQLHTRWKAWVEGGAICSEMESAAIFIIASIHRKRAGGVMMMVGSGEGLPKTEAEKELFHGDRAIRTAIEGVKILIDMDRETA